MNRRVRGWIFVGVGALLWMGAPEGIAQEKMSASGLLSETGRLLDREEYGAAIPFMVEYLERMKLSTDARVHSMMQDIRFKLGKIKNHFGESDAATTYFHEYLESRPVYKRREVLKLLAVSYFELSEFEQSISAVTNAFAPAPAPEISETHGKVQVEGLSKEERGGLSERQLRRYEKVADRADEDLFGGLSADEPSEETEYTLEERVLLTLTLAESYAALEEWESSIEPYQFVIENASQQDRRGYAIMQQIRSWIEMEEFARVRTLIFQLVQTNVRYDIRVNMAMMNAASALFNVAEYDSALTLYRMVLPRKMLADYQVTKLNVLRTTAGLPEVVIQMTTNAAERVETLLGRKISDEFPTDSFLAADTDGTWMDLEESISTVLSLPPYEEDVMYRMGQLYAEVKRPWEALASFNRVVAFESDSDLGTRAFCEALQVLRDPLQEYDRLETRALEFLGKYTEGLAPRQVAYQLTAAYQKQERMKDIKKLRPTLDGWVPSDDPLDLQYECELYYMQAIADLMLLNYKEARDGFAQLLRTYPGSHQEDNLTYWHAMTQLFLQDYELALDEFGRYLDRFPTGVWRAEPWFHSGICLFALEKYEQAMERFTYVIDTFPGSSVYPDACSMRGDILGSKGLLDEAARDYQEALDTAQKPEQATYAVFQMAALFEAEGRYDEIIALVNTYLDHYGNEADVAKAAYWMGKTKIQQGSLDEAVAVYRDTIVSYGGDIRQDGVDLIITELMAVSRRLGDEECDQLKESLRTALTATESVTLRLRLRVLLARMEGTEVALGSTLMAEMDDLTQAPPPILAVICEAAFAQEDYSLSEEILTLFLNYFEDSEFMRSAYKLRAFDLYSTGELEESMKMVAEVQGLYGTDMDMAWAQLMKGRLEIEKGALAAAHETFQAVLGVRAWRGAAYAESAYSLGEIEEKEGDLKQAFAWYQRTYSQYKAHAKGFWAAESYLASARCLLSMGLETDMRNTYRAMLYDKYVNTLPQADIARTALGADEVLEINAWIATGGQTNVTVTLEAENRGQRIEDGDLGEGK